MSVTDAVRKGETRHFTFEEAKKPEKKVVVVQPPPPKAVPVVAVAKTVSNLTANATSA